MINLKNKNIIVTGASGGIGNSIVEKLFKVDANILATGTKIDKLNSIKSKFDKIKILQFDISKHDKIENFINEATDLLGGSLDCIVNNAGITKDNLLIRMKAEDIDNVVNINLLSLIKISKCVLKNMMKQKFGRIISISSVVGFTGNPGQVNYCASKSGITGFTKSLALEVASRGITVNAIAPGYINSAMTDKISDPQRDSIISNIPVGRIGKPSDISNAVIFLAREEASYITGNTIHVNGGLAMF